MEVFLFDGGWGLVRPEKMRGITESCVFGYSKPSITFSTNKSSLLKLTCCEEWEMESFLGCLRDREFNKLSWGKNLWEGGCGS